MYVTLQRGDALPTVALAQARLVECGAVSLVVDGVFGPRTEQAVTEFQRRVRIPQTARVDANTWKALCSGHPLAVVDALDATDIVVFQEDARRLGDGHSELIVSYGMSGGTRELVERLTLTHQLRSVALLRFHGHGGPGNMGVSEGHDAYGSSAVTGAQFSNPVAIQAYARLGMMMKLYGSIELHGCRVGAGSKGHQLLRRMAHVTGVPVSAGVYYQRGGPAAARFEGPVRTCFPKDRNLRSWAQRVFAECQS